MKCLVFLVVKVEKVVIMLGNSKRYKCVKLNNGPPKTRMSLSPEFVTIFPPLAKGILRHD